MDARGCAGTARIGHGGADEDIRVLQPRRDEDGAIPQLLIRLAVDLGGQLLGRARRERIRLLCLCERHAVRPAPDLAPLRIEQGKVIVLPRRMRDGIRLRALVAHGQLQQETAALFVHGQLLGEIADAHPGVGVRCRAHSGRVRGRYADADAAADARLRRRGEGRGEEGGREKSGE